jgi:hypothetical protein
MVDLMMRNATFDDDGTIHAWGLLGPSLEVSIDFDELENLEWFNKKETFQDVAPAFLGGFTLWTMTQNFGYHLKDDGTCEVYHHGETFNGFFPIRLLFQIHSHYVIWATEKYINSPAFGVEDKESDLEEQRHNIPLHVFKNFIERLHVEVEKEKENKTNLEQKTELEHTLRRLKTIQENTHKAASLPRLRTLRSHKTNVTRAHLIIDDKETKDTIEAAMRHIGSNSGNRNAPGKELGKLARHATLVTQKKARSP